MIRALRSAFFRYRKTRLPLYVLILSVVAALAVVRHVNFEINANIISIYMFLRPRYFDNTIVIYSIYYLTYAIPFLSAVYCMIFTGSDISARAVNNRIATGISRAAVCFSDLMFNAISTLASLIICLTVIYIYAKYVPVKENVRLDADIIGLFLRVTVICLAFTTLFTLIQFFFSNKFFGIIVSLLLMPCMITITQSMQDALENPYRYSYKDEETGEMKWELNPDYVGGTARDVLTVVYKCSPYSEYMYEDDSSSYYQVIGAGAIIVISTALGYVTVNGKEYS